MATTTKSTRSKSATSETKTKQTSNKSLKKQPDQNSSKKETDQNSEFHEFFVDELKDIYWAEKHLVKALPKMQKAATSNELSAAFEKHTEETNTHIATLEQVFSLLEEKASAKKCDAMEGLLKEADSIMQDTEKGTLIRDAGLILAAQKVEHYEIATYGTLVTLAKNMGNTKVAELLQFTLDNEKETDAALTAVAESFVNEQAVAE